MPAIITNKFRIHNSEQFSESFSEASPNVYYMGLGRPQAFATSTRGDSRTENEGTDSAPLTPIDDIQTEFFTFDDLLAVKKIASSDTTFCIPRRDWVTGTHYDIYRHDYGNRVTGGTTTQAANSGATNLYDATFFVMNSSFQVYKCLDNDGDTASTVAPSGTSTSILSTGDDYKWKYMYTLTAAQRSNFLSTDFMPVATDSTVSAAATDGAVNICRIKTAGSGGANGTHTGVAIRGDGSSGVASVTVAGGAVTAVAVTTPGTGYTYGYIRNADIVTAGATSLSGSEVDVIIEPRGGHGYNAVEELGGFFVMLNVNFEGTESSGSAASATTLRGTKAVLLTGTPGSFVVDEEINQATTGAVGKVVEYDATNKILYFIQTRFNDEGVDSNGNATAFSGTNVITGQGSSATGTPSSSSSTVNNVVIVSGYSVPEIDADSGDVIYIENRTKITRAADQTENVKLIVEF